MILSASPLRSPAGTAGKTTWDRVLAETVPPGRYGARDGREDLPRWRITERYSDRGRYGARPGRPGRPVPGGAWTGRPLAATEPGRDGREDLADAMAWCTDRGVPLRSPAGTAGKTSSSATGS